MPRRWEGKWFKKSSGAKKSRHGKGRGQSRGLRTQASAVATPVIQVEFRQRGDARRRPVDGLGDTTTRRLVDPTPPARRHPHRPTTPSPASFGIVTDPKPEPATRNRRHRRRPHQK